MGIDYYTLAFELDDPDYVVQHMHEMLILGDGRRWINFRPDLPAEVMAVADTKPSVFSGKGPRVPTATWVPGERNKHGEMGTTHAGITHPRRKEAKERLAADNIVVPDTWIVEQDHPKRGLTFIIPTNDDPKTAVDFLTKAAACLSGVKTTNKWTAIIAVR